MTLPVVLAHQGGWDEILLFVAPVLLAIWAIRRVEKRRGKTTALEREQQAPTESQPSQED